MDAEPLEDFYILVCPFVPFRTCGWGSQPHTAIIAVWHFILTDSQYVVVSWDVKHFPEFYFERHKPCLLVLPFGTTARNLCLVDLTCCQALA